MDSSLIILYTPILIMALFGVPHGALDAAILRARLPASHQIAALAGYVGMAVSTVLAWYFAPTAAMLLFLALSVLHFGRSDIADQAPPLPLAQVVARGGLWAIVLPLLHWSSVAPMFSELNTDPATIKYALTLAFGGWLLACAALVYLALRRRTHAAVAPLAIGLILIYCLPPLWSLTAYFCAWHARRHTQQVLHTLPDAQGARALGRRITALTLLVSLTIGFMMVSSVSLDTATIRLFFVGIFALTVPHMVLIDYYLPRYYPLGAQT